MSRTREIALWSAGLLVTSEATREMLAPSDSASSYPTTPAMVIAVPQPVHEDSLQTLGNLVVDGDVFRIARHSSSAEYDGRIGAAPSGPTAPQFTAPPPTKLTLTLRAIIGGPPWQGVIDGVPGHGEGLIVRPGDRIERLMVRSIGKDTVIIQAPDTTYRLTLRSEW